MKLFDKRVRREVDSMDWRLYLRNTAHNVFNTLENSKMVKNNKEWATNVYTAKKFVASVLKEYERITAEVFYFALYYGLLLVDEEHTHLADFKYQYYIYRLPMYTFYSFKYNLVFDAVSMATVVAVIPKDSDSPVSIDAYINTITTRFPSKCFTPNTQKYIHAQYLCIYNPFFPVKAVIVRRDNKHIVIKQYSNMLGYLGYRTGLDEIPYAGVPLHLPEDVPFSYVNYPDFNYNYWTKYVNDNSNKPLLVLDMRNNHGGSVLYVYYLVLYILRQFCSKDTMKRLIRQSHYQYIQTDYGEDLEYEWFLNSQRDHYYKYIKELRRSKDRGPDRTLASDVLKDYIRCEYKYVVAVLINDQCFSACRSACAILSKLPNTVFVGSDIYLKMPSSVLYEFTKTDLIYYKHGLTGIKGDIYKPLNADIPLNSFNSGMSIAIHLHGHIDSFRKIVEKKLKY